MGALVGVGPHSSMVQAFGKAVVGLDLGMGIEMAF